MAVGDLDDSMRRPLAWRRQLEYAGTYCLIGKGRCGNSDEGVQEYRAIVVGRVQRRRVRRPLMVAVAGPMTMNLPGVVVLGGVVIGMRVHERSAQGRSLDGQRERDGEDPPHDVPIVRDPSSRRQGKLGRGG